MRARVRAQQESLMSKGVWYNEIDPVAEAFIRVYMEVRGIG